MLRASLVGCTVVEYLNSSMSLSPSSLLKKSRSLCSSATRHIAMDQGDTELWQYLEDSGHVVGGGGGGGERRDKNPASSSGGRGKLPAASDDETKRKERLMKARSFCKRQRNKFTVTDLEATLPDGIPLPPEPPPLPPSNLDPTLHSPPLPPPEDDIQIIPPPPESVPIPPQSWIYPPDRGLQQMANQSTRSRQFSRMFASSQQAGFTNISAGKNSFWKVTSSSHIRQNMRIHSEASRAYVEASCDMQEDFQEASRKVFCEYNENLFDRSWNKSSRIENRRLNMNMNMDEQSSNDFISIIETKSREFRSNTILDEYRYWSTFGGSKKCRGGTKFRLLSYNVLAQDLLEGNAGLYRGLNYNDLSWSVRWQRIKAEVTLFDPHIVTLQEVQFKKPNYFNSHYLPFFEKLGYRAVFKCRTGDKNDGCVIFYKKQMFKLDCYTKLEYFKPGDNILDRDNIGLVARLVPRQEPDSAGLVVATTHLLFNKKRIDVRLAQAAILLAEVDKMRDRNGEMCPVIITGDFNSNTTSPIYHLMISGKEKFSGLQAGRRTLTDHLLSPDLGLTYGCQYKSVIKERKSRASAHTDLQTVVDHDDGQSASHSKGEETYGVSPPPPRGFLTHSLNLESVFRDLEDHHHRDPVVTTNHGEWILVDYIFYSCNTDNLLVNKKHNLDTSSSKKATQASANATTSSTSSDKDTTPSRRYDKAGGCEKDLPENSGQPGGRKRKRSGQLKLVSRLMLPRRSEMENIGRIPSHLCPSDHFPLLAEFVLTH